VLCASSGLLDSGHRSAVESSGKLVSNCARPVQGGADGIQSQGDRMPTLLINGQEQQLDVPNDMPLLWALRDVLGLTGTKFGCGIALCGACTVHLDGRPIRSCITPVANVVGKKITTVEAISETESGAKIQRAWLNIEVVQCGYCQSGQIMSAAALLESNPNPNDTDIDAAMSGNICRCGTYPRIRAAIKQASQST
jgi:isoquinoline 1-oxidoreductase alpha subunit